MKLIYIATVMLASCVSVQKPAPPPAATPTPIPAPAPAQNALPTLSWGHADWTAALASEIQAHFAVLDTAKDIATFCPKYAGLSVAQRQIAWDVLIEWTAYYESGWNPAENSQDVGTATNRDTWSVGLLQLSVVDQANYGFPFGYSFADLQTAGKNIHLGVAILAAQIARHGLVAIPAGGTGLYWSTLHPGGKYDKSGPIAKNVQTVKGCL